MDPTNGENQSRVDTNLNEPEQVEIPNENQLEKDIKEGNENLKEQISTQENTQTESSEHPVEEKAQTLPQADQITAASTDDKDNTHNDKETGKEKESQPQSKLHWKNTRKKKKEEVGDVAQWPTPDEARSSRGHTAKKSQGEPGRSPNKSERSDRERPNQSARGRKAGINWKPLPEFPKTQSSEQSSSNGAPPTTSSGGIEGERVGANQGSFSAPGGAGRGYQGYGRGQPKRRGSRSQHTPWPRNNAGTPQQFSQDGSNESGSPVTQEVEGKDDSQFQDPAASGSNANPGQSSNPTESRRYRGGSVRGASSRSSGRWRGGANTRGATHFNRYNPSRGQPFAPLRPPPPQDPEQLRELIKKQIEYYFGVDNLCKDIFLRKNMNNEGWISVHLILNFNRVRELNVDLPHFVDALKDSTVVELKDEFVRRRDDWAGWTFPPRVVEGTSPSKPEASAATETKDQ